MARTIKSVKFSKILLTASLSNLVSTLIGFPIMWLLMFAVQCSAWVILQNSEKAVQAILGMVVLIIACMTLLIPVIVLKSPLSWILRAAILCGALLTPMISDNLWIFVGAYLFLMILFFFLSYWIEYAVTKSFMKNFNPKEEQRTIKSAVFKANIASYILLIPFPLVLCAWPSVFKKPLGYLFSCFERLIFFQ
jgi:hypothetical protein